MKEEMNDGPPPRLEHAILGFRAWRPTTSGLAAMAAGHVWKPGVNRSVCKKRSSSGFFYAYDPFQIPSPRDHAPHHGCSCGLYAWHTLERLENAYSSAVIFGAVAGWGATVVHEDGFRCEFARVLALSPSPRPAAHNGDRPGGERFYRALCALYAEEYEVPLVDYEMLQLEGARHAQGVPDLLRPDPELAIDFDSLMNAFGPATRRMAQEWTMTTASDPTVSAKQPRVVPQSPAQRHQARHAQFAPSRKHRAPRRLDPPV